MSHPLSTPISPRLPYSYALCVFLLLAHPPPSTPKKPSVFFRALPCSSRHDVCATLGRAFRVPDARRSCVPFYFLNIMFDTQKFVSFVRLLVGSFSPCSHTQPHKQENNEKMSSFTAFRRCFGVGVGGAVYATIMVGTRIIQTMSRHYACTCIFLSVFLVFRV